MILSKLLLITVFNYFSGFMEMLNTDKVSNPCREIQVSWSKTDTAGGQNNGSIVLKFTGERSDYAVYLLTPAGKTKLKSTETLIGNLKKGKHAIVITGEREGSDFCQKFFEVVIN